MFFLFIILALPIDQAEIDSAMVILRSQYYGRTRIENVQYRTPAFVGAGRMREYYHGISSRDDIIIGDIPAETLAVTGYFFYSGNIIVINDGVLYIHDADFNLDGNISVLDNGQAIIDSSTLSIIQQHIYHRVIAVTDSGRFTMTNTTTDFAGYQIGFAVQGWGECIMENVTNDDWITAVVSQQAQAELTHVDHAGEWLFADDCSAEFHDIDVLLTWYFCADSSIVDFSFPSDDTVNGFVFDSTLSTVTNIGYHVTIDSSTGCMWATIPLAGSDVTIRDSDLRVTGLMLEGVDSYSVSGLVNGLFYEDFILPVEDRNYHLINSTVQTWNVYPSGATSLELTNSIFGELCGFDSSYSVVENAFCDGSGGHIEASHTAFVLVALSGIAADVITKNNGICILGYSAMIYGRIWVTGSSMMIMINTQFPEDPEVSDTAIVFVAAVDGPSTASTGDTVGILGSAWITPGPYHPYDFGAYRLHYRITGDTAWTPIHEEQYVEVHRDTLGYWNTVGLEPALYDIRLVLKDDVGDSVEASKQIMLTNTGQMDENVDLIVSNRIVLYQEGHRLFRIITSAPHHIRIYDILGREISRVSGEETVWLAPASGVYFVKDARGVLSRKLVAF
jgi:hypothetical protein